VPSSSKILSDEPVVIVGAGPTGLVAATLLAQHGLRVVLLERHVGAYPGPRAVHLDDEVLRILQQAGIAEEFLAISRPAAGLRLLDAGHRVIAEFRRDQWPGRHGYPQANLFDQPDLESLLRRNLARYPLVELRSGVSLTGLVPSAAAVQVQYQDVAGFARGTIAASAVLGCDGAGSTVRELIGSRLRDLRFEERWLVIDVRTSAPLRVWDGVEQVCDPRRAATFMRIGADRYRWEFRLHEGETAAALTTPDRLRSLLAPWLGEHPEAELELRRGAEYTFRARLADRWRRGRVFLLGDAAHLTPPFVGQGLGSGLRDAQNLAWKLAQVLTGEAGERLLDSYQAEREPHARALIRLAVLTGWAMTGGQDRAAALRRGGLALLCRVPGFTGMILDGTSPRLRPGPLVRPRPRAERIRRPGRELAGTLCPQPWVTLNGTRHRLDDVLPAGFTLLTAGPPGTSSMIVQAFSAGENHVIVFESPELRRWLDRARMGSVRLRPDHIILGSAAPGRPIW
jgi:3-(3-hydroxy-phenyl)propionate hydroxylase